jgi:simple sugar transport system permease protein
MSDVPTPAAPAPPEPEPGEGMAERIAFQQRLGGIVPPLLTAVIAFLMGGLVVLATGHDPIQAYWGILKGAGLTWFAHPNLDPLGSLTTYNLTQTILRTSTLILTGLAVAFAFRCGLFNIGGNGQYIMGVLVAIWIGTRWDTGLPRPLHVLIGVVLASLAGAAWAGIAGILKATVGAHEVISTIMLNWIAYWLGSYLLGAGGPLQNPDYKATGNPVSSDVVQSARIPVFWGDAELQGVHYGVFVALAALVAFYLILNRTTLGYEVRAVGYSPDAAAYGGISVKKNFFLAMAISGTFAGLAGGLDILGWQYRYGQLDIQAVSVGFIGIAVALLGRNTAVGVFLAAILFGALDYGTTKGLDPEVFDPTLAGNLTYMIEGLVVLFVGADLLILWLWNLRRKSFTMPRLGEKGV